MFVEGRHGDRGRGALHRRGRPPLRIRGPVGVPGAPRGRSLPRHERRGARPALPRCGADHQHARRHPAAAGARRNRPARLHGHGPGRDRAEGPPGRTRGDRVPRPARRLLHLGAQLRQSRTAGCPGHVRTPFVPSPPPVVLDFWDNDVAPPTRRRSRRSETGASDARTSRFEGRVYRWSKHQRVPEDPRPAAADAERRSSSRFRATRPTTGCCSRSTAGGSARASRSREISTAIATTSSARPGSCRSPRSRTSISARGWFSERSATYLAAGRPVILQDTGFGAALPTGEGLFAFADLDEAVEAMAEVHERPGAPPTRRTRGGARVSEPRGRARRHARPRRAATLARRLVDRARSPAPAQLPRQLSLKVPRAAPWSSKPRHADYILGRPIPSVRHPGIAPAASVVMPVAGNLACTRLALESLLANTDEPAYEVVVVDNGSPKEIREYLEVLAARNRHLRVIHNERNLGFAAACNQGLASAEGEKLVLLSNDTIVSPGWLSGLGDPSRRRRDRARRADHQSAPAGTRRFPPATEPTRRCCGFARRRNREHGGRCADRLRPLAEMFCAAIRRECLEGGRCASTSASRSAGSRMTTRTAFAPPATGSSAPTTSSSTASAADSQRAARPIPSREAMARRIEEAVQRHVPEGSRVLVVSRGDEALADFDGYEVWHFPQLDDGGDAGRRSDRRGSDRRAGAAARAGRRLPRGSGDGAFVARAPRGIPAPPRALRAARATTLTPRSSATSASPRMPGSRRGADRERRSVRAASGPAARARCSRATSC